MIILALLIAILLIAAGGVWINPWIFLAIVVILFAFWYERGRRAPPPPPP